MKNQRQREEYNELARSLNRNNEFDCSVEAISKDIEELSTFLKHRELTDPETLKRALTNYRKDGAVVQNLIRGEEAGEAIWAEWRRYVCTLARKKGIEDEAIEDLAHEVFLQTRKAIRTYRFQSRLKTYFHAIFLNCYRRWLRNRKRRVKIVPLESSTNHEPERRIQAPGSVGEGSPESCAIHRTQQEMLTSLIEKKIKTVLSQEDFQILYWYYVENRYIDEGSSKVVKWTDRQIGEALRMPLNTVTSRRLRSLRRLRQDHTLARAFAQITGEPLSPIM